MLGGGNFSEFPIRNFWRENSVVNSCLFAFCIVPTINNFDYQCAAHIYYSCDHELDWLNQQYITSLNLSVKAQKS